MHVDGTLSVTGNHIQNSDAIAAALNGDETLVAMIRRADTEITVAIAGESPGPRGDLTFGDTLDISEEGIAISNQAGERSEGIRVAREPMWESTEKNWGVSRYWFDDRHELHVQSPQPNH